MTSVAASNVKVVSFEGGGDDMDGPIKSLTMDRSFQNKWGLCSVNSINIGRIVVQTVHYFWSYLRTHMDVKSMGDEERGSRLQVAVPTGAMGNITAGLFAREMGLPVETLVCGVNENDILDRAVRTGEFHRADSMARTLSEAINIQVPYNFERVLYLVADGETNQVSDWMRDVDGTGKLTLPRRWVSRLQERLVTCRVTDPDMLDTMSTYWHRYKYLIDPHTAVAAYAASAAGLLEGDTTVAPQSSPVVVLATAHPCKFQEAVCACLGDAFWETHFTPTSNSEPGQYRRDCDRRAEGIQGMGSSVGLMAVMPRRAAGLYAMDEVPAECFEAGKNWTYLLRIAVEGLGADTERTPQCRL